MIKINNLSKSYKENKALNNISFEIKAGEIFGLLGPNGAGKTTTVEILVGVCTLDEGEIYIRDQPLEQMWQQWKLQTGVQLQEAVFPAKIKLTEALKLYGSFYDKQTPMPVLLEWVALKEKAGAFYHTLSAGQKKRFSLAVALVGDPEVVFLDEPSAELDPRGRRQVWQLIQSLRDQTKTVILATHDMEEAQQLCDRVAVINSGKLMIEGTPQQIMDQCGLTHRIEIRCPGVQMEQLKALPEVLALRSQGATLKLDTSQANRLLVQLCSVYPDIIVEKIEKPTLEDAFFVLTSKAVPP